MAFLRTVKYSAYKDHVCNGWYVRSKIKNKSVVVLKIKKGWTRLPRCSGIVPKFKIKKLELTAELRAARGLS